MKYRKGDLPVRVLNFKDQSGAAKVCLFGDNAEMAFEVDDGLQISGLTTADFNQNNYMQGKVFY